MPRDSLQAPHADFATCALAAERKSRLVKDCMQLKTCFPSRKNAVPHTQSYDTRLVILFAPPFRCVNRTNLRQRGDSIAINPECIFKDAQHLNIACRRQRRENLSPVIVGCLMCIQADLTLDEN